jgi:hypothetical protein
MLMMIIIVCLSEKAAGLECEEPRKSLSEVNAKLDRIEAKLEATETVLLSRLASKEDVKDIRKEIADQERRLLAEKEKREQEEARASEHRKLMEQFARQTNDTVTKNLELSQNIYNVVRNLWEFHVDSIGTVTLWIIVGLAVFNQAMPAFFASEKVAFEHISLTSYAFSVLTHASVYSVMRGCERQVQWIGFDPTKYVAGIGSGVFFYLHGSFLLAKTFYDCFCIKQKERVEVRRIIAVARQEAKAVCLAAMQHHVPGIIPPPGASEIESPLYKPDEDQDRPVCVRMKHVVHIAVIAVSVLVTVFVSQLVLAKTTGVKSQFPVDLPQIAANISSGFGVVLPSMAANTTL